ncbi:MAG: hypothetical protein NC115_01545 [Bacteroidales bacterium]|nr:hypothetical protein [Bacteroidales bacterium]
MVHNIYKALLILVAMALGASCTRQTMDWSAMAEPEFNLILDQLSPDMNTSDNIPVICVVRSEAGLKQVCMYIGRGSAENPEETLYKKITDFHDPYQFSLKESPKWSEDMLEIRIEATDRGDRTKEAVLPVSVIPYKPAPEIAFELDKIEVDETTGSMLSPVTKFTVTSQTTVTDIKINLFQRDGIKSIGLTPAFTPRNEYSFEQQIDYVDGDTALQVAATDEYGKVKIETLPIIYTAVPAPVIVPSGETVAEPVISSSGPGGTFTFHFTSEGGAAAAKTLKLAKGEWREIQELFVTYDNVREGDYNVTIPAYGTDMNALKFQVIDRLGRIGELEIATVIDMRAVFDCRVGAQCYAKHGSEEYPDAFPFFSIRDLKCVNLYQAWEEKRNVDLVFYYFNNGQPGGTVRLYEALINRPDAEWPESQDAELGIPLYSKWPERNQTVRRKFDPGRFSFDFNTVTVDDLLGTAVQNRLSEGQTNADFCDYANGEAFFFRTGPMSACPNTTGMVKIEKLDKNTTSANYGKGYYIISVKVANPVE